MYIKRITNLQLDTPSSNVTVRENNFEALIGSKLYLINKNNNLVGIKNLNNKYTILTYNDDLKQYAISKNNTKQIEKLNYNYEEFSNIPLKNIPNLKLLNDITYDNVNKKYLIAEDKRIYSIDEYGNYIKREVDNDDFFTKLTCNFNKKSTRCFMENIYPNDLVFTAVGTNGINKYVAYTKNNSAYLAQISKNGSKIQELFVGDNIKINSIVFNDELYINVIDDNNDLLYEISLEDDKSTDPKIIGVLSNLNNLINNVSQGELSVSNLVDVESSKIKKAVDTLSDFNIILQTNESAANTLKEVSNIEKVQSDNLNLILQAIIELEKYINKK